MTELLHGHQQKRGLTVNKPSCFESADQYRQWVSLAKTSGLPVTHWYCTDCTPGYQAKMIDAERCGFPGVTFLHSCGELVGHRSEAEVLAEKQKGSK